MGCHRGRQTVARVGTYGVRMRSGVQGQVFQGQVLQSQAQADPGDEINLGTVARALWRNKLAILGPTILMAVAAFIAVTLITPSYKSAARELIEVLEHIFFRPEAYVALMDRGTVDAET